MQLEDLNLVAAANRPGQVAKSKPERATVVRALPKGRDVLAVLPKGYGPRKKRFCHCQRALRRLLTREFPRQCKYPV